MIESTKRWLAAHYKISEGKAESYFKNEDVTGFLIVWTIFEQKLFGGVIQYNNIKKHSTTITPTIIDELEREFVYFFERYQDRDRFKNLRYEQNAEEIKGILGFTKESLSAEQKLQFFLFVVYRYKNNIFHGNKSVPSWARYETEIGYCVNIMKALLESAV